MHRFIIAFFLVCFCVFAQAQEPSNDDFQPNATISDDLTVFIHTGSSRNYRIVGTILAGAPIAILDREGDPEFVQILDAEGRTGWIEGQYVSSSGSIRTQVPDLQNQIESLNQQLSELREQYQQARSQNIALEQQNKRIAGELETALENAAELQLKVDTADNTEMIEWFTRGGIVAAVCILLGILLTYLPKKRRRNDQWM